MTPDKRKSTFVEAFGALVITAIVTWFCYGGGEPPLAHLFRAVIERPRIYAPTESGDSVRIHFSPGAIQYLKFVDGKPVMVDR